MQGVIDAVLNSEGKIGGEWGWRPMMICAHYSEPLLRDTRRCECSWTCVLPTFHRLKMEFSGTSNGLIVSCGNFQCGFLNLIPVPHHKHVAWGRQGGHALHVCFSFHNPLLLRNFISLLSRSGWAVAVSVFLAEQNKL